jgi:hypothetical protein
MNVAPIAASPHPLAAPPRPYNGPARLAADNDGDGRKGAAALNDGDAASRIAQTANSAITNGRPNGTARIDIKV